MKDQLYESICRLPDWLEKNDYRGYDTFAGLNARLLRPLTFNRKFLRTVLQQGVRRLPINMRPLLGVAKSHSTKGIQSFFCLRVRANPAKAPNPASAGTGHNRLPGSTTCRCLLKRKGTREPKLPSPAKRFQGSDLFTLTLSAIKHTRFLVFPSEWYETFARVAVEAFACGVPVIASRLGAIAEIVEDGRTGLHFTPGDPEDLAAKVEWAWTHPHAMEEMGRAARCEYEAKTLPSAITRC